MNSVRSAALIWMTVLLTLVGLVGAGAAYVVDLSQANGLLDRQLRQMALSADPAMTAPLAVSGAMRSAARPEFNDGVVVQFWGDHDVVTSSNAPEIGIPRLATTGFGTLIANGEPWRGYRLFDGRVSVQASQRISVRTGLARTAALEAAVPILVTIPLGWFVVGWGLDRVLRRLSVLAAEVAIRGAESRNPIPVADIPAEVLPLVEAMNLLIGRLQTSIDQQKRFVSDAAHELRTPLAALRLQIGNLLPGGDKAEIESALADLGLGAERAADLVDQLLRLARYETAAHQPALESVELVPLILSCVADHLQIAEGKQVDLGVVASDPSMIMGHERDLKILFGNLIQNAVRYTPAGGIVDVAVRNRNGAVAVEVSDTGCGIKEDLLPRVFDRFFRAAPPDIGGTGLGLAICQAIAEQHGLTIILGNRSDRQGLIARVSGATSIG